MARCSNCDAEIPAGGSFCVECGAPAPQAATGATERLPEPASGPVCAFCGTRNPPGATFCVTCGRAITTRPVAEPPTSSAPTMPEPHPLAMPANPNVPNPQPAPSAWGGMNPAAWGGITGGVWLIGLAVLFLTGRWWPGILVLVGISSLLSGLGARSAAQRFGSLQGAIWMFGIAVLAVTGLWFPGILILIGLSAILGAVVRPKQW